MTDQVTREHGIVPDGAADAPAAPRVAADAWDSHAFVLSTKGCMSPQRWPTRGLVACCNSNSLSVACVTERGSREHGIVSGRTIIAPAAVGDVLKSPDSYAHVPWHCLTLKPAVCPNEVPVECGCRDCLLQ